MKTVTKEEVERVLEKYSGYFISTKKQEILNELFPPEFKVGDWVVVLGSDEFYYNSSKGNAQKILSISDDTNKRYTLLFKDLSTNSYTDLRHATPEEIEAAQWEANKPYKVWLDGETVLISADEVGYFYRHGGFSGATAKHTKYEKL